MDRGRVIEADAAVIGGGLVGMTLAIALADAGLEVVVADRQPAEAMTEVSFDGRVSAIAYSSRRMLEAIGLWPELAGDAQPILDIRVTDGSSPLFLHYDHREVGDQPLGHIVENRRIRTALHRVAAATPGLRILAPAAIVGLELEHAPARILVSLADGRRIRADLAAAADGRHSPTRTAAGIPVVSWTYHQTAIVCTIAHELPHHGVAQERFLPVGPFAILPMTGNRSSLVWTEDRSLAPAILALDEGEFLAEVAWRFGDYLGALRAQGPRWSYPLGVAMAERYVGERLALVGDAAHTIHPLAGQGLNLGLRDVAALAEAVTDAARLGLDPGGPDALRRYQRWRRFDSLLMMAVTDGLNRAFSTDLAPLRLARDLGMAAVDRLPPLKRLFMRHAMGLTGDLPRLLRGERL